MTGIQLVMSGTIDRPPSLTRFDRPSLSRRSAFLSGFLIETDTYTGGSGGCVKLPRVKSFAEAPLKLEIAQEQALHSTPDDYEPIDLERACAAINAVFTLDLVVSSPCYSADHA
jgi:hypothetical protein